MPVLCQEMSRFRQWHVKMYGSGHIILCDGQKEARKSQEKEKPAEYGTLIACLQNGEKEEIKKWLDNYFLEWSEREGGIGKGAFELTEKIYSSVIAVNSAVEEQMEDKAELYGLLSAAEGISLLREILEQFLEKITDILSGLSGDRRLEIVNRVRQIIEKEYSEPLTMEYLAEKVYMSPNYLRTLFKDYTGETILEYITRIRMERSVVLLKETNMRVNDISKKVGYENPSHYCAVFRKQMGVTPNQFRSKLTGKGAL